jgi:hypothetical protein
MSVKLIRGARGAVYLILIVGLILFVILLHVWLARLLPSCFVRDKTRGNERHHAKTRFHSSNLD